MNSEELYMDFMSRFDALNLPHMRDAFVAGMEAARPQWHDLRKDLNDLPEMEDEIYSVSVLVAIKYTTKRIKIKIVNAKHILVLTHKSWICCESFDFGNGYHFKPKYEDVIAWMPLPEWKGGVQ